MLHGGGTPEKIEQGDGHRSIEHRQRRRHQLDVGTMGVGSVLRSRDLAHATIVQPDPFNRVADPLPTTMSYRPRPHLGPQFDLSPGWLGRGIEMTAE